MTLRVELKIMPFGIESDEYRIGYIDIANIGEVDNLGFGHSICNYSVTLFKPNGMAFESDEPKILERHDRRDGAIELARRACELVESL